METNPNTYILRAVPPETKDVIRELCRQIDTLTNRVAIVSKWFEDEKAKNDELHTIIRNYETYGQPTEPEAG